MTGHNISFATKYRLLDIGYKKKKNRSHIKNDGHIYVTTTLHEYKDEGDFSPWKLTVLESNKKMFCEQRSRKIDVCFYLLMFIYIIYFYNLILILSFFFFSIVKLVVH